MKRLLPDICDIQYGYAFDSNLFSTIKGIPLIRIRDVVRGYSETYTEENFPEKYIVNNGDILIGMDGEFNIARWQGGRAALNQRVCKLIPHTDVDGRYLFYAMPSKLKAVEDKTPFVTVKHLSAQKLNAIEIQLPPIEQQKASADCLDAVNRNITLCETQLAKLDTLVKSRFIEMFGDPVTNPMGWSKPFVENVVSSEKNALKAGPFGSSLKKEYYVKSGYKIYGQEQVISGDPSFGDYYIDEERFKMLENCSVQAGDMLISLVGTYGKLLIIPDEYEPGIINPRLMKITFDKGKVNPIYFKLFFQSDSLKKFLSENTHGGTMDILNLGIVKRIPIPVPPIALQNQFADFVQQVDKSKSVLQKLLEKQELLQAALMQEYFG